MCDAGPLPKDVQEVTKVAEIYIKIKEEKKRGLGCKSRWRFIAKCPRALGVCVCVCVRACVRACVCVCVQIQNLAFDLVTRRDTYLDHW